MTETNAPHPDRDGPSISGEEPHDGAAVEVRGQVHDALRRARGDLASNRDLACVRRKRDHVFVADAGGSGVGGVNFDELLAVQLVSVPGVDRRAFIKAGGAQINLRDDITHGYIKVK